MGWKGSWIAEICKEEGETEAISNPHDYPVLGSPDNVQMSGTWCAHILKRHGFLKRRDSVLWREVLRVVDLMGLVMLF